MAFHTITVAPGLHGGDRAKAIGAAPPHATTSTGYPDLLVSAGFGEIDEVNVTEQWRDTAAAWLHESADAAEQLAGVFGIDEYRQAQQERHETLEAIDDGLLHRSLLVARAP